LTNNTLLGLLTGIFLGVVLVVFLERADRTIQEPGDAPFYLGVPELGIIPSESVENRRAVIARVGAPDSSESAGLMVMQRKSSAMAEAFRSTLTSILFAGEDGQCPQVLVISSSAPREGKSTLSSNLAVALAEIHKRVLLIDADLRRPRMHHIFEVDNETGLVDLLRRREPLQGHLNGSVSPTAVPNLSLMPSGQAGHGDPTLLHSRRIAEVVDQARKEYDVVLIDTPPMLTMADARVIARYTDGVILVTRANQTSRDAIRDGFRRFTEDGTRVIGTILNDWNPKKSGRYGYYKYYGKYSKHYYGGTEKS
jgi:capsular exopolysaccharide synthesis family protein